jgi:predicted metal-dependent phosphoesterase TrpH
MLLYIEVILRIFSLYLEGCILSGDLHCHTRLSDGTLGIEDLIAFAKKKGLETIAITDHDCLAGTVRSKVIGARHGIQVIPGVELSSTDPEAGKQVHVLCYLPDAPDMLEGLCKRNSLARKKASHFMMLQTAKRYPVSTEFIIKCATGSTNLYKKHIMQALIECGYSDSFNGELYKSLFSKSSENNILVEAKYENVKDVIDSIHTAGGIAILAHPYASECVDEISKYVEYGIDGIEVFHPSADEEQQANLKKIASKHKLLMTGGSDFHGLYNTYKVSLGDYTTPDDCLHALLTYKSKQKRLQKKLAQQAVTE